MIITNPVCCCHAPLKPNTRISRSLSMYVPQVRYQTNDSWEVVSAGRPLTGGVSGFPILHKAKYMNADGKLEDYWVGWHKKNATKFAVSLKPHSYMAFSY